MYNTCICYLQFCVDNPVVASTLNINDSSDVEVSYLELDNSITSAPLAIIHFYCRLLIRDRGTTLGDEGFLELRVLPRPQVARSPFGGALWAALPRLPRIVACVIAVLLV